MNSGLVLEIHSKYAIVLGKDGTVVRVKLKPEMLIGDTIYYFDEDFYSGSSTTSFFTRNKVWVSAAAAVAAVLLFILPGILSTQSEMVLSLDINPSIQFHINDKMEITGVEALNEEGAALIGDWEEKDVALAIEDYLQKLKTSGFEGEDDTFLVAVGGKEGNLTDLERLLKGKLQEYDVLMLSGSKEDIKKAAKEGISLGRYEAKNKYQISDADTASINSMKDRLVKESGVKYWKKKQVETEDEEEDDVSAPVQPTKPKPPKKPSPSKPVSTPPQHPDDDDDDMDSDDGDDAEDRVDGDADNPNVEEDSDDEDVEVEESDDDSEDTDDED